MSKQQRNYDKVIYKKANNQMIFSVADHTNDMWDVEDYNNLIFKFVQFDNNNNAKVYLPIYVDADEIRSILTQIIYGNFNKHKFTGDMKGQYISYGGSKSGGLGQKRQKGDLKPIIDGTEARLLKIGFSDNGDLFVKGEVYKGQVMNGGAIRKKGDAVASLYYKFSNGTDILTMATTIVEYLNAKQTLCISNYIQSKSRKEIS